MAGADGANAVVGRVRREKNGESGGQGGKRYGDQGREYRLRLLSRETGLNILTSGKLWGTAAPVVMALRERMPRFSWE